LRVFATKEFARFARKERIGSSQLCEAVRRAGSGLIDADLGGGVIKQRVARQGQGRSGGYRTIIAFRSGDRSVFMYGFAKKSKANISDDELEVVNAGPIPGQCGGLKAGQGRRGCVEARRAPREGPFVLSRFVIDGDGTIRGR